jgi:prepilin-type N-terminal cleavage/methylation domain-containing protein
MKRNSKPVKRSGFTLSEMLVVLGVMVVFTALAQPAMRGALSDSRLRSAAKLVRVELAKTRLKAIQSGVAQRFRYQAGKNRFEISPALRDDSQQRLARHADRDRRRPPAPRRDDRAAEPVGHGEETLQQSLPEGIHFDDLPSASPADRAGAEEGWSEPIVFHPNGRTEDAHIRLKGDRNAVVEVSLRGLTGVATASRPRHEEELR